MNEMDKKEILRGLKAVSAQIEQNKEYLTKLDQQFGDGDLGISMSEGFRAVVYYLEETEETNIAKLWSTCGTVLNQAAPSSLGTILSFVFKGMAKSMKGLDKFNLEDLSQAMLMGAEYAMEKAGSKLGEKTFFDSFVPGAEALKNDVFVKEILQKAFQASADGCENTKKMKAVRGRAAYYGNDSIGKLDGGAVVGMLIFKALIL